MNILMVSVTNAQSSVFTTEQQNAISFSEVKPSGFFFGSHTFSSKSNFGMFEFALIGQTWGEIIVGPNYTFVPNENTIIETGIGFGLEVYDLPFRGMAYVFTQYNPNKSWKGRVQSLVSFEYGGSGYWYLGYVTYHPIQHFGLGIHVQAGVVAGLRLQVTPISKLMIHATSGWNIEGNQPGFLVGIRGMF